MEDRGTADGEADYGSESGDQCEVGAEVEDVGCDGGDREDESNHVEPERGVYWSAEIFAEPELQQKSGESDGRYDDQSQGTGESAVAGVDDHQSKRQEKESGGDDGPTAGLGRRGRVGMRVGQ